MEYEKVIILRVSEETRLWLDELSASSGVTVSKIVRSILDHVRVAGKVEGDKVIWGTDTEYE